MTNHRKNMFYILLSS